jgi:transcriptional regulator with XRE-family HTH domain
MANTGSAGMALGVRIRAYRADKGLAQTDLATAAGLSKTYICELENGAGRRPSGDALLRIADALGVTIADILGRGGVTATASEEPPKRLAAFAADQQLPEADVTMLASIRFRDEQPRTARRWRYIYDAIRTSRALDDGP